MLELGSRQNMTGMETKRARGKSIANALICQLCLNFLFPKARNANSLFAEPETHMNAK